MKLFLNIILILSLSSTFFFARAFNTSIEGVHVDDSRFDFLSIQNRSNELVRLEVLGDDFILNPASGVILECKGYIDIEVVIVDKDYLPFQAPCKSRVSFSEMYISNQ